MEGVFVLVLVGVTSVGAYVIGVRGLRLSGGEIRRAVGKVLEGLGMALAFFGVNLAAGVFVILTARVLTRGFVSLYLASDETLLVLSLIQGLTFQWWWDQSVSGPPNVSRR
ncbi:MAG: hypothetical protein ACE5IQ_05450 [Candidatus Methylomirabilales bacterium]